MLTAFFTLLIRILIKFSEVFKKIAMTMFLFLKQNPLDKLSSFFAVP